MPSVTPPGGPKPPDTNPPSDDPNKKTPPAHPTGGKGETMTEFMKQFTPDERKKFMKILNQNLANELSREKRVHEDNVKYRKELDPDSYK